jgi:hypothetical protein
MSVKFIAAPSKPPLEIDLASFDRSRLGGARAQDEADFLMPSTNFPHPERSEA